MTEFVSQINQRKYGPIVSVCTFNSAVIVATRDGYLFRLKQEHHKDPYTIELLEFVDNDY
jgi:hypothetical protein